LSALPNLSNWLCNMSLAWPASISASEHSDREIATCFRQPETDSFRLMRVGQSLTQHMTKDNSASHRGSSRGLGSPPRIPFLALIGRSGPSPCSLAFGPVLVGAVSLAVSELHLRARSFSSLSRALHWIAARFTSTRLDRTLPDRALTLSANANGGQRYPPTIVSGDSGLAHLLWPCGRNPRVPSTFTRAHLLLEGKQHLIFTRAAERCNDRTQL
jgi:hypothetical protein